MLQVITGPMYSGKTEALISRLAEARNAGKQVILFKPNIDTRYRADDVVSHNGAHFKALSLNVGQEDKLWNSAPLSHAVKHSSLVAFDEGNLFSATLINLCRVIMAMHIDVIVAGLNLDCRGEPFWPMPTLMAMADKVDVLTAKCEVCGKPATKTQRITPGDGSLIQVGGKEMYEARCSWCFVPFKEEGNEDR